MTPEQFTDTYSQNRGRLVSIARRLVGDQATAEDVVQDVFVKLLKTEPADLATLPRYLTVAARNRAKDILRQRVTAGALCNAQPDNVPSAEHTAIDALRRLAVAAAVRKLPPRQRNVIALTVYQGLSEIETAQRLSMARGTVKSHSARARASLRVLLAKEAA